MELDDDITFLGCCLFLPFPFACVIAFEPDDFQDYALPF